MRVRSIQYYTLIFNIFRDLQHYLYTRTFLFIVLCGFRAMGARRGWIRISMRLKIAMRWVPAERGIKAEKKFSEEIRPADPDFQKACVVKY